MTRAVALNASARYDVNSRTGDLDTSGSAGGQPCTEDPFVRHYVYDAVRNWVPQLWRRDVKAGHWVPMSHPQVLRSAARGKVM
jgi:hypothetical protein